MANQARYPIRSLCRVLKVSPSGFYDWRDRPPSARALSDAVMTERIRSIHAESDATYGMPRVRAELIDQGTAVTRQRTLGLGGLGLTTHLVQGLANVVRPQLDNRNTGELAQVADATLVKLDGLGLEVQRLVRA